MERLRVWLNRDRHMSVLYLRSKSELNVLHLSSHSFVDIDDETLRYERITGNRYRPYYPNIC